MTRTGGGMNDKIAIKAREALYRFCQGKERMCIPAQPDDDDMIISAALDELEKLHNEMERSRQREQKLIEGLKLFSDKKNWFEVIDRKLHDSGFPKPVPWAWVSMTVPWEIAESLLQELGVTLDD